MKYLFSIFFILGLILSGVNLGFSSTGFDCCYSGVSIDIKGEGACVGDSIDLDSIATIDECRALRSTRLSCDAGSKVYCTAQPGKALIYDDVQITSKYSDYCTGGFPVYVDGDCDNNPPESDIPSTGETTGGYVPPTNPLNENDFSTEQITELNTICKDGGGFLGLFVNKNTCNGIELTGGNTCVFNPISSGNFNSFFASSESLGVGKFEKQSCVVDKALRSCSDLKIQSLCGGGDSSEVSNLDGTCKWINSVDFVSSELSGGVDASGICVSKEVSEFTYFNKVEYYYLENVIKNPGFELGVADWTITSGAISSNDKLAHFGNKFVELDSGSSLSQNIKDLTTNLTYKLNFQMRSASSDLAGGVDIFYDGEQIGETFTLNSLKSDSYGKYIINSISFKPTSSSGLLNFVYTEGVGAVHVDSINLKISDASVPMTNEDDIFSSVNIVPAAASNCNLCFTDLGFNFCTENKSDLLGSCSYMTTEPNLPYGFGIDLTTNLGGDVVYGNNLLSEGNKWESQSLANSLLFCEMYVNRSQCIDPSNYVNSEFSNSHFSTQDQLCKWSEVPVSVGCYKDSNGDDKFDTINNYVNVDGVDTPYAKDLSEDSSLKPELKVSDFQLGCDILPPETHVALSGRNANGESIFLGLNSDGSIIGDVYLEVLATDLLLESCSDFDFNHLLYVEYELFYGGGIFKNKTLEISANQYSLTSTKINEFLVDEDGSSLITGAELLTVKIVDQSGNVGKIWSLELNIDNVGPNIELLSPGSIGDLKDIELTGTINKLGKVLEFKFTDDTNVSSCRYTLDGIGGVDSNFYNASGVMPIVSSGEVLHNFTLPITNSSPNGDGYILTVQCSDIFEQNSSVNIFFVIDTDTQLMLVTPQSFHSKKAFSGFLSSKSNVTLTSSDSKLVSCELGFNNLALGLKSFNVTDYNSTLHDDLLGDFVHSDLKKVIFGEIDFSVDGVYTGNYSCTDEGGNIFYEEHTYYYDTVSPEFLNFSIIADNLSRYVADDGKTYLNGAKVGLDYGLILNLSVNGTGSWINSDLTMLLNNNFNGESGDVLIPEFSDDVLLNDSFDSTFIADIHVDMENLAHGRDVTNQTGLKEINLIINLTDKAGNSGGSNFSFFHDSSVPELKFSGDVFDFDVTDDLIFSQVEDPNVIVSFSAPDYRKFTCDISLKSIGRNSIIQSYELVNSFEFKLSELDTAGWFETSKEITVIVRCIDVYGISLDKTLRLIYDNTPLALNEIGLVGGEEIYSRLTTNHVPLVDNIYLNFNDTDELGGYLCKFKFNKKDINYNCETNYTSFGWFDTLGFKSTPQDIISGFRYDYSSDMNNYFCVRTEDFTAAERNNFDADTDFSTKLELEVFCEDGAGFNVTKKVPINYTYLTKGLISFDYEYSGLDNVKFIVKSLFDYSSIKIAGKSDGTSLLLEVDTFVDQLDGTFLYTSRDYPLGGVPEGILSLFAVPFLNNGVPDDSLYDEFMIDTSTPFGNLTVQDLNEDNEVFGGNFVVNINITDEFSGLDYVDLYVDGEKIAEFNGFDYPWLNEEFDIELASFTNPLFTPDGNFLNVDLLFKNATLGSKYNFEIVVSDKVGHEFTDSVSVTYADGVYLNLLDSVDTAVFDYGLGWLTNSSTPTLEFETSKIVTCKMSSTKGGFILFGPEGDFFSFDLSLTDGFNLTELGDEIDFKIECSNSESTYQFTKTLLLNDRLLDYVLVPESSFLVNEKPYIVSAQILSVGPFSKMTCGYEFGGKTFSNSIGGGYSNINLNFSGLSSGTYILKLNCIDSIGNFGPNKEYSFDVQIDGPLVLDYSSLVLTSSDGYGSVLDGGSDLFIHSVSGVNLKFNLNKQNLVNCEYGIDPVGGVLSGFVNFFRGLFGVERYSVVSTTPYEFTVSGLSFSNPVSNLEILCYDDIGGRIKKSYSVSYVDNPLNISAQRISS